MRIGIDLDGTLLDSRRRHVEALLRVAGHLAIPFSEDKARCYFELKCNGATGVEALRQLNVPAAEDIAQRWLALIENTEMLTLDKLYPDTLEVLKRQQHAGDIFVLVTARRDSAAVKHQIASLGLEPVLHEIIVLNPMDQTRSKAIATKNHGLQAVVGDTEVDLGWAENLSVPFFASAFGFRSVEYWRQQNVDTYASLSEIFRMMEV